MGGTPVSATISDEAVEKIDQMSAFLRRTKRVVLESAIETFATLSPEIRDVLSSGREDEKRLILDLLRALRVPSPPDKSRGK